jgi:hypothetical protein
MENYHGEYGRFTESIAFWFEGVGFMLDDSHEDTVKNWIKEVTHWMPLPEPPDDPLQREQEK